MIGRATARVSTPHPPHSRPYNDDGVQESAFMVRAGAVERSGGDPCGRPGSIGRFASNHHKPVRSPWQLFSFKHKLLARGLVEQHEYNRQDEQVARYDRRVYMVDVWDVNVVEWIDEGGQSADCAPTQYPFPVVLADVGNEWRDPY